MKKCFDCPNLCSVTILRPYLGFLLISQAFSFLELILLQSFCYIWTLHFACISQYLAITLPLFLHEHGIQPLYKMTHRHTHIQTHGKGLQTMHSWEEHVSLKAWGKLGGPAGSAGKELARSVGELGSIPGLGRSPGGLQCSCRKNPQGRRSLGSYSPRGPKESGRTEPLSQPSSTPRQTVVPVLEFLILSSSRILRTHFFLFINPHP